MDMGWRSRLMGCNIFLSKLKVDIAWIVLNMSWSFLLSLFMNSGVACFCLSHVV